MDGREKGWLHPLEFHTMISYDPESVTVPMPYYEQRAVHSGERPQQKLEIKLTKSSALFKNNIYTITECQKLHNNHQ